MNGASAVCALSRDKPGLIAEAPPVISGLMGLVRGGDDVSPQLPAARISPFMR